MSSIVLEVLVFGGLLTVLAVIALASYYLRRWLSPRGYEKQPLHISQTPEGASRHADRMTGLRALAEGIDDDLPAEQDRATTGAEEQAAPAERAAEEPANADVDAGW